MISGILLAAGQSRRMGAFKQLLPFGRSTIIETCIENLRAAAIDELIVVVGHRAAELSEYLHAQPIKLVVNQHYLTGMTSSVQAGLRAANREAEAILLALVDQPRVSTVTIDQIIARYRETASLIVKPQYQGRSGHPIIIDRKCHDQIWQLDPSLGLNTITRAHKDQTAYLNIDDDSVIVDIDTPEDYQREKR